MNALARLLEAAPASDLRATRARVHREINREPRAANRLLEALCVALSDELGRRGLAAPDCPYCRASVVPGAAAHRPRRTAGTAAALDRMPDAEAMALGAALVEGLP